VEIALDGQFAVLAEGQIGVGVIQAARAAAGVEHAFGLMQALDQGHVLDGFAGVVLARFQPLAGVGLVAGRRGSAPASGAGQRLARSHGRQLLGRAGLGNLLVGQLRAERKRKRAGGAGDEHGAGGERSHFAGLPKSPFMRSISMRWSVSTLVAKSAMFGSSPLPGWARRSATICRAPVWCWIMPVRNKRSNAAPCAAPSAFICAGVSMPDIIPMGLPSSIMPCGVCLGTAWPRAVSHTVMALISSLCEIRILSPSSCSSWLLVWLGMRATICSAARRPTTP